jgi:hypothetical protein
VEDATNIIAQALKDCVNTTQNLFRTMYLERLEASPATKDLKRDYMNQLQYFLVMHNGWCIFSRNQQRTLIGDGIAYFTPANEDIGVSSIVEMPVRDALKTYFDGIPEFPENDPILNTIDSRMTDLGDKGMAAQMVACRLIMRAKTFGQLLFLETNPQGVTKDIVDLLNSIKVEVKQCGFSFEFEECYDGENPIVSSADVNQTLSLSLSNFEEPAHVLINQKNSANVDTTGALTHPSNNQKILYWIQTKNWRLKITKSVMKAALESVHPWHVLKSAEKQKQLYLRWWSEEDPFSGLFIRILVSFSGFSKGVQDEISKYNRKHSLQPVFLWQPTKEQLGSTLAANRIFQYKASKDHHTKSVISPEVLEVHSLQYYLDAHKDDAMVKEFLSTQKYSSSSNPPAVPPTQTAKSVLPPQISKPAASQVSYPAAIPQLSEPTTPQLPKPQLPKPATAQQAHSSLLSQLPPQHTKPAQLSIMNPVKACIAGQTYIIPRSQITTTTNYHHIPKRRRYNISVVNPRMSLQFFNLEDAEQKPN